MKKEKKRRIDALETLLTCIYFDFEPTLKEGKVKEFIKKVAIALVDSGILFKNELLSNNPVYLAERKMNKLI